jgi:hypothetical protein
VIETREDWSRVLYGRSISAREYFVYDLSADKFLVRSGEGSQILYPASITKLFTAYVAMQYLQPDELITVGNEIWLIDEDSSVAEIAKDDVLTAEQLVAGLLLPSGNDAAQTLAVTVGRKLAEDPEMNVWAASDRFVEEMNRMAQELGMTLEIMPMDFDACQAAVASGKVDMSISGYSWTEKRAANYNLSDYYYAGENETEQVLITTSENAGKFTTAESLKGAKVGAQGASLQEQLVLDQLPAAE